MPDNPFSVANTARAVHDTLDEALAVIPAGHSQAVLIDATAKAGKPNVRAVYAYKLDDRWRIGAEAEWRGGKHVDGKVAVQWSR